MEKLIELIWEWQKEMHPDGIYLPVVAYRDWIFWSDSDCLSSVMDEIHLISKPCGFIKWLVDNDKILEAEVRPIQIYDYEWKYCDDQFWYGWFNQWLYYRLIMELAISDTPIKDLISYLK